MKKTGIFYGSTTGNTESVAERIADQLGIGQEDIHNVADAKVDDVEPYEALLLGCSTWGVGELQDDWNDFLYKLKDKKLNGKVVALFGCGDAVSFGSSFCDALGLIHHELEHTGCEFTGEVSTDDYRFDSSEAVIDNQFVGLPLDENNEADKTDQRIKAWTDRLKETFY